MFIYINIESHLGESFSTGKYIYIYTYIYIYIYIYIYVYESYLGESFSTGNFYPLIFTP
jgi:hypothetical protein